MVIPMEEKKAEAISRMKLLGIYSGTIEQFEQDNKVSISERPLGAYYWTDEKTKAVIDHLAKQGLLVYTGIRSYTEIGTMDALLYVSDDRDAWESERNDLKQDESISYVFNRDADDCSEFGYIGFKMAIAGGLIRVW